MPLRFLRRAISEVRSYRFRLMLHFAETRLLRLYSRPFLWVALGNSGGLVAEVTGKERDESHVTVASFITGA